MQRNDYRYKRITYFQELCTAVPLRLALSSSTVWLPYLSSNTCCNTHCVSSYHHHSLKQLQDQLYPTSIHCRVGCCEQTLVGILVSPTAFAVVDATSLQDKLKSIIIYYFKKKQKQTRFFQKLTKMSNRYRAIIFNTVIATCTTASIELNQRTRRASWRFWQSTRRGCVLFVWPHHEEIPIERGHSSLLYIELYSPL